MATNARNGKLIASFPVEDADQIMLVTDAGQLIRCPVDGIRIAGRATQGVIVFNTAEGEHVVSVERIREDEDAAADGAEAGGADGASELGSDAADPSGEQGGPDGEAGPGEGEMPPEA